MNFYKPQRMITKPQYFTFIGSILLYCFFWMNATPNSTENLLRNGSFEDIPRHSTTPEEWLNWGASAESPPDIHPSGTFMVTKSAKHGDTYLGLVVRDNNTWEVIAQKLDRPLQKDKKYQLSGYMARSPEYISISKLTNERANYSTPVVLSVNGAMSSESRFEQLVITSPIKKYRWQYFEFTLKPASDMAYLILQAYFDTVQEKPYNGHLLLDGLELVEL